jgi:hypothetical protein
MMTNGKSRRLWQLHRSTYVALLLSIGPQDQVDQFELAQLGSVAPPARLPHDGIPWLQAWGWSFRGDSLVCQLFLSQSCVVPCMADFVSQHAGRVVIAA